MSFYYIGGGIPADRDAYVLREIDTELSDFLIGTSDKRFCHVLAARQMGKTSLMKRLINNLNDESIRIFIEINIQGFGEVNSEIVLYSTILSRICNQINACIEDKNINEYVNSKMEEKNNIAPGLKFQDCLKYILRVIEDKKLIIFLDEIQCLINWNLQNSFFGVMKAIAENDNLIWKRINIVLLGLVNPCDLITNYTYSVNHYQPFEMTNLSGKCEALWSGLNEITIKPEIIISAVLKWTGGKPFLTQYLCDRILHECQKKNISLDSETKIYKEIENLVKSKILPELNQKDSQNHLKSIQDWFLLNNFNLKEKIESLSLYEKLLEIENHVDFNSGSYKQMELIISGLATRENKTLKIACPIYREIFDKDWAVSTVKTLTHKLEGNMYEQLKDRDYVIIIDRSASMKTPDQKGGMTRWKAVEEVIKAIYWELNEKYDPDGVTIYLFANSFKKIPDIQNEQKIMKIFEEFGPVLGGTNLDEVLQDAINIYFQRKSDKEKLKKNGQIILVFTDGEPNDENAVISVIIEATQKLKSREELGISFIRVGEDKGAIEFLEKIDDGLIPLGAIHDICDTKSLTQVQNMEDLSELLLDAIRD